METSSFDTLVFYAAHDENDTPDQKFESLLLYYYDEDENFLGVDIAPYLTVLDAQQMLEEIQLQLNTANDLFKENMLNKIKNWVNLMVSKGYPFFMYELEPKQLAGKAYPLAANEKL